MASHQGNPYIHRHSAKAYPGRPEHLIPWMLYAGNAPDRVYLGTFPTEQAAREAFSGLPLDPQPAPVAPVVVDPVLASLREKVVHIPGEAGKSLTWEQLEKPHFIYGFRINGRDGVDEVKRGFSHNPESVLTTAQRFTSRKLVLAFTITVYTPGENNRAAAYALEQKMKREDASHLIPGGGDEVFDLDILPDWTEADYVNGEIVPMSVGVAA